MPGARIVKDVDMRRALVAGNWKMNGTQASIKALMSELLPAIASGINGVDVVVCPPFPYLDQVADAAFGSELVLGAQNVSVAAKGAYTGDVAAAMLADFRVRYVIVGHSERRQIFGENDELIAAKFAAARQAGMIPVLCVGETRAQRDAGEAEKAVAGQVQAVLERCGIAAFDGAVIAYEPVWAIGSGQSATPAQAQEMHAFLRESIAEHDESIADVIQIIYGGSVTAENAEELFASPDIDGGLVGGASLDAQAFIRICNSVS